MYIDRSSTCYLRPSCRSVDQYEVAPYFSDCNEVTISIFYNFFILSSQSESPSIYGLAGLCSLALLSGDSELAVASLNELIKCGESKEAIKLKAVFNSYMSALGVSETKLFIRKQPISMFQPYSKACSDRPTSSLLLNFLSFHFSLTKKSHTLSKFHV